MKNILVAKNQCCGCSACQDVCPKNAITMVEDKEGFLYPAIYETKCVDCGMCYKVCPNINVKPKESLLKAYAAYYKNEEIRFKSSSGGIFSLIAEDILKKNGIVYGAAFDENFEVKHIRITDIAELEKLRGSKYVQSNCNGIYVICKKDLDSGMNVLFSGTPCQIEALKCYLKKSYDNLFCIDIICHGVPSRLVWRKYLQYRVNFAKSKIEQIAFRLKNEGWKQYAVQFVFANGTAYCQNLHKDIFMRGFLKNLYLRPSCYACKFKTKERISDITLADFWGINNIYPDIDDDKGISLVIVHSIKGSNLFEKLKTNMFCIEVNIDNAIKYNKSMIISVKNNIERNKFFSELLNYDYIETLIEKYSKDTFKEKLKKYLKVILLKFGIFNFIKTTLRKIKE